MTGRKVLILIEELPQGGLTAQRMALPASERDLRPIEEKPIYAEKLPGKLGLINRIGNRLTEIFKPE